MSGKRRGRPQNRLLFELAKPCRRKGRERKMTRCIGMKPNANGAGCDQTFAWGNGKSGRQRNRILSHSVSCEFISDDLRERARVALKPKAPTQKKIDAQAKLNPQVPVSDDGCVSTYVQVTYKLLTDSSLVDHMSQVRPNFYSSRIQSSKA